MKINSFTANLMTDDMTATVEFYTKLLDFTVKMSVPDAPPYGWAMLTHGDVTVMFQTRESIAEDMPFMQEIPIGGSLGFYAHVEDVRGWYARLKGHVRIAFEERTTFYGMTEFGFYDNNGYMITLAENLQG